MRFWDSSAIVPLVVEEVKTAAMKYFFAQDPSLAVWWATEVECVSAIARRQRSTHLPDIHALESLARLEELAQAWEVGQPSPAILETAIRLLQTHDLRAADALQLAAAFAASEGRPSTLRFVSLDARLNQAALREGFQLVEIET